MEEIEIVTILGDDVGKVTQLQHETCWMQLTLIATSRKSFPIPLNAGYSETMAPRRNRRQRQKARVGRWLWGSFAVIVVIGVAGVLFANGWVKRYLRTDAFRDFMNVQVSKTLHTWGKFEPFEWNGSSVYSETYRAQGLTTGPFEQLHAHGLRAGVDFGSFRSEAWEIDQVSVNRLTFVVSDDERRKMMPPPVPQPLRSFWSRFIPQQVAIGKIAVADASFAAGTGDERVVAEHGRLTLMPLAGSEGWSVISEGGTMTLTDWPLLTVSTIHARLHDHSLFVTDAGFRFHDSAKMQVNGEFNLGEGTLRLRTDVDRLAADKVFEEDWRQRLLGTIHADVRSNGKLSEPSSVQHQGRVWLKDGVLMALPVLDRIASYTSTERFRRLVLDEASADFVLQGKSLILSNLSLRSDGLVQITGELNVSDPFHPTASPQIDGVLEVGVVHGVLKWLPGAEKKVFTSEREGYLWTTMRVQGTLDALQEDLSPRLTSAAMTTTVEKVPEKGLDVSRRLLDGAAGVLGGDAGRVLRGTGGAVLNTAEEVVGGGLRFVPMIVAPVQ